MTKFSSNYFTGLLAPLLVAAICSFGTLSAQEGILKTEADMLRALELLEKEKQQEKIVPVPRRSGVTVESSSAETSSSPLEILPALPEALPVAEAPDTPEVPNAAPTLGAVIPDVPDIVLAAKSTTPGELGHDDATHKTGGAKAHAGEGSEGHVHVADGYGKAHGHADGTHAADAHGEGGHDKVSLIDPDLPMFLLFLLVTLAAFFLLSKYVWKPILATLDEREEKILASLENAEKVEVELAQMETTRTETIAAADAKAKVIIEEARKGGSELQRVMEEEGKENARILRENAEREIGSATEKAQAQLRTDSAELAVQLASRILGEELNGDRAKSFTDELIQKL